MRMKRSIFAAIAVLFFAALGSSASGRETFAPVDQVSTLVGTLSKFDLSAGNTYPAAARPWGTHFWTPQTGANDDHWTYVYIADKIRGIKMTHQASPWLGDYGQFSIMPVTTGPIVDENERASWFSHKAEIATPYYYSVYLAEHDTSIELTPTERAACFRITYPERERSYLVVDAFKGGSEIRIEGNRILGLSVKNNGGAAEGFKLWFVIESDTPFDSAETVESEPGHACALVGFKTVRGQQVNLRVAASFVSAAQAEYNLSELGDKGFDAVKAEGRKVWNDILGRIRVEGDSQDDIRTFYSCLYRSLLFPRDLSEVTPDGRRVHRSPHDGQVHDGYLFTDNCFWDTFRSLYALMNLLWPEQSVKVQEGLINHYLESGFLTECSSPGHRDGMIGNGSAAVVAEAWLKGLRGYDIETLWKAVNHNAHSVMPGISATGRYGWQQYDSLGWVPCDIGIRESAARTLEYAYEDWCIWQLGLSLGKGEEEIAPYRKAAGNYRNLYRADAGMMSGRCADGSWPVPFNPFKWGGDFTEGNAIQYSWSVFHDPAGYAELLGGWDAFEKSLDAIFEVPPIYDDSYYGFTIHEIREMQIMNVGNYAHGNQPAQHVTYLYDWCLKPWKTQEKVREVMRRFYTPLPDGYCGDEDNGQTSAWYVFSALGFYPVCPASGEYAIGSPLFRKATLSLPSGRRIVISAPGNGPGKVYVRKLRAGLRGISRNYLTHKELTRGMRLRFTMSDKPCKGRGTSVQDAPYSLSNQQI